LFPLFATSVIDTGAKFSMESTTSYRLFTLTCEYLCILLKKFEMTLKLFSGAWGKMIHEKKILKKKLFSGVLNKPVAKIL
jgi:hypothetical protein